MSKPAAVPALSSSATEMKEVKFNQINFTKEESEKLAGDLTKQGSKITHVRFTKSQIDPEALKNLVAALQHPNCQVDRLDLVQSEIDDTKAQILFPLAANSQYKVKVLNLDDNYISDEGLRVLVDATRIESKSVEFSLTNNEVTDQGAEYLLNFLRETKSNSSFVLLFNTITPEKLAEIMLQTAQNEERLAQKDNIAQRVLDLEQQQEALQQALEYALREKVQDQVKLEELRKQLAELGEEIRFLKEIPQSLRNLDLKESQIIALQEISGDDLRGLSKFDLNDLADQINQNKANLEKIIEEQRSEESRKILELINLTDHFKIIDKKTEFEKFKLQNDQDLQEFAATIQAKFNEGFLTAIVLGSGKIQSAAGKVTSALEIAGTVFGEVSGVSTALGIAALASGQLGESRRDSRYAKLCDLVPDKDLRKANKLSEEIGRKIALTSEVKIKGDLAGKKNDKERNKYYENVAKKCLEEVLSGRVDEYIKTNYNEQKRTNSMWIKAIGVCAEIINETQNIYVVEEKEIKILHQQLKSSQPSEAKKGSDLELISLVKQQGEIIKQQSADIAELKKQVQQMNQPNSSISPNATETLISQPEKGNSQVY